MSVSDCGIVLFYSPGACSRVALNALEEAGVDYTARFVDFSRAEQKSPAFLGLNPKGKVPALNWQGRILTESPAILWFLAKTYPKAGLVPDSDGDFAAAGVLSDLCWCSSALHPMARQMIAPMKWTVAEAEGSGISDDGWAKFRPECDRISDRLAAAPWWYGDVWSIMDVYLYWLFSQAERFTSFSLRNYPALAAHGARVMARPSYQRALEREARGAVKPG